MENKYKVLKKFGDLKKGDVLNPIEDKYDGTEEDLTQAVEDGFLAVVAPDAPKKGKKTAVTVSWRGNTREFSLETHGEDFETLAEQFAEKFEGTIE